MELKTTFHGPQWNQSSEVISRVTIQFLIMLASRLTCLIAMAAFGIALASSFISLINRVSVASQSLVINTIPPFLDRVSTDQSRYRRWFVLSVLFRTDEGPSKSLSIDGSPCRRI